MGLRKDVADARHEIRSLEQGFQQRYLCSFNVDFEYPDIVVDFFEIAYEVNLSDLDPDIPTHI